MFEVILYLVAQKSFFYGHSLPIPISILMHLPLMICPHIIGFIVIFTNIAVSFLPYWHFLLRDEFVMPTLFMLVFVLAGGELFVAPVTFEFEWPVLMFSHLFVHNSVKLIHFPDFFEILYTLLT